MRKGGGGRPLNSVVRRHVKSVIALMFMVIVGAAVAAPQPRVTGVYSNLFYHPKGGDVLGMEVQIIATSRGHFAVIQCAEGAPSKPVVVSVIVRGTEVELAPHDDAESHCPKSTFRGKVTAQGLRGKFDGVDYEDYSRLMRRGKSYWQ
jgi:hypothetical protein